jgi:ceramide glucosyltransferase
MIAYWTSIAALLIAIVGCGYLLAATVLVGRFARAQTPGTAATTPTVTILKPLYGDDADLVDNLMSFAEQRYAGGAHRASSSSSSMRRSTAPTARSAT